MGLFGGHRESMVVLKTGPELRLEEAGLYSLPPPAPPG